MLGPDFRYIWLGSAISNIGDGVTMIAGPLLVAPVSGAYVDRLDRRRLVIAVNLARCAVLAGLAAAVWSGVATIPLAMLDLGGDAIGTLLGGLLARVDIAHHPVLARRGRHHPPGRHGLAPPHRRRPHLTPLIMGECGTKASPVADSSMINRTPAPVR